MNWDDQSNMADSTTDFLVAINLRWGSRHHGDDRIHGTSLVYLPIHEWLILMVNVSDYTSPMDPNGGCFFF